MLKLVFDAAAIGLAADAKLVKVCCQSVNGLATIGAEAAWRAAARASGLWPRTSASSFQSSVIRLTVAVAISEAPVA